MGAHLDVCCDICGDEGVLEAIATCSRCKLSREHLYCMRVYRKEVPEDWCCESCVQITMPREHIQPKKNVQTAKVKPLTSEEVIRLSSGSKFSPGKNNHARNTTVPSLMKNRTAFSPEKSKAVIRANPSLMPLKQMNPPPRHGTSHINNAASRQQRFVKEPRESSASAESVSRKVVFQPSVKEHKQENFQQKQAMVAPRDIASSTMAAPKDVVLTKMVAPKDVVSTKMAALKDVVSAKMAASSMVEKDNLKTPPVGESITKDNQLALNSGGPASPDTVLKPEHTRAITKCVPSGVDQCEYGPTPHHFWMGSIRVTDNAKFSEDRIQAHHPSRVHKRVYELSKKIPAVLDFELVDRKGIWVEMFPDYLPDQKDIALYLKPTNGKRSNNFISMLEHLEAKDLGLSMVMDRIELLVFTSKALHEDYQKFEGSDFLWGVFRKRVLKPASGPLDLYVADQNQEDNAGVDMEIDMVGGLDVGIKEIIIPKTRLLLPTLALKTEKCDDIPPGFKSSHRLGPQTPSGGSGGGICGGKLVKVEPPD